MCTEAAEYLFEDEVEILVLLGDFFDEGFFPCSSLFFWEQLDLSGKSFSEIENRRAMERNPIG